MPIRNRFPALLTLLLLLTLAATSLVAQTSGEGSPPTSDDDKILYAIGVAMGQNLGQFGLSPAELDSVQKGIADSALGREPQINMQEFGPKIQTFAQSRMAQAAAGEKAAGAAFLQQAAAEEGAASKESGLIFTELVAGEGASPGPTAKVTVHYTGTLRDGTVFDSSVARGAPVQFGLDQVIPCWTEGLQLLKAGGKGRLVCPSDIAYGDQGRPPQIQPGAVLVFEVELISIDGA